MENEDKNLGEKTVYETCFLILPSIPEKEVGDVVSKIKDVVSQVGGQELDGEVPFKHPLSYQMSKNVGANHYVVNEAYIGWIKFEIESSKILDLNSQIEKLSEILRFLTVKAPRKTEFTFAKAKALIKAKEDKEREDEEAPIEPVEEVKEAII